MNTINKAETWEERCAREAAEAQETRKRNDALIASIVKEVAKVSSLTNVQEERRPERAETHPYDELGDLLGFSADGGVSVHFSVGGYRHAGRVVVSAGFWPSYVEVRGADCRGQPQVKRHDFTPYECLSYNDPRRNSLSITISADKSPAHIAKDIVCRLLPDYLAVLKICQDARARRIKQIGSRLTLAAELSAAAGRPHRPASSDGSYIVGEYGSQQWEVSSDDAKLEPRRFKREKALLVAKFFRLLDAGKTAGLSAALEQADAGTPARTITPKQAATVREAFDALLFAAVERGPRGGAR